MIPNIANSSSAIRKGNAKRTNVHFIIQNLKADDHLMSSEQGDRRRGDVNENERERTGEDYKL